MSFQVKMSVKLITIVIPCPADPISETYTAFDALFDSWAHRRRVLLVQSKLQVDGTLINVYEGSADDLDTLIGWLESLTDDDETSLQGFDLLEVSRVTTFGTLRLPPTSRATFETLKE